MVICLIVIPLSSGSVGQLRAGEMSPQLLLAGLNARLGLEIIIITIDDCYHFHHLTLAVVVDTDFAQFAPEALSGVT